jgi:hypothetical protein
MTSYNDHKSWIITHAVINLLSTQAYGIDNTITINTSDLQNCINSLKIKDFDFSFVKSLKRNLAFENYKIVYREKTVLKIQKMVLND